MPIGSRVCPACGKLNSLEDAHCLRCGRRIPGPLASGVGRAAEALFGKQCPMTRAFIALSALVYVATAWGSGGVSLLGGGRLSEYLRWGALFDQVGTEQPFRYLSAMFVHFGILHVGMNAMALLSLGRGIEQADGSARLVVLFLGSGIVGFVASDFFAGPGEVTGGISGGVFGLMGAYAGRRFAEGDPAWKRIAVTGLGYAAALALLMGGGINNTAHVAGLLSGGGLNWALFRWARGRAASRWLTTAASLLTLACVVSIALSHAGSEWREQRAREERSLRR